MGVLVFSSTQAAPAGAAAPTPAALLARTPLARALLLCALLLALGSAAADASAATLTWARSPGTAGIAAKGPLSLSCASATSCVAVDAEGFALVGSSPSSSYDEGWSKVEVAHGKDLTGVSCPTSSVCVAVGSEGSAYTSSAPASAGSWHAVPIPSATSLTGVSCAPGSSTCVAVSSTGSAYYSVDSGASWSAEDIDAGNHLTAVSCASTSLCVAVDEKGNDLLSTEPAAGRPWTVAQIANGSALNAISCEAGGLCVALDQAGYAIAIASPTTPPALAATEIGASSPLTADSCVPGLCVALQQAGTALASSAPTAVPAAWSAAALPEVAAGASSDAVACVPSSVCVALAAPSTSAGTLQAFTAAVPVVKPTEPPASEKPPAPPPLSVLTPTPTIAGVPAAGKALTCEPGLPPGTTATLTYRWLSNTAPIAGAVNPKYKVRSREEGDHIQCEVTATNAAGSAKRTSSYVAIPLVKVPVSVGETSVTAATVGRGLVSFAVLCSDHAIDACRIEADLTLYERVHGTKVLAVSARRPGGGAKGAAARAHAPRGSGAAKGRHGATSHVRVPTKVEEVTVGRITVTVKPGHERKLSVKLNATGRTLAVGRRALPATFTVSGTVIGVMTGKLRSEPVKIEPVPGAGRHAHRPARGRHAKKAVRRGR
ncbi:MAG: hypothetical protein ACYCUM_10840 [Solirubrobacteraceae bacterium]